MIINCSMKKKVNLLYAFEFILLSWINYFSGYCDAEPIVGGYFDLEEESIWLVSIQILANDQWRHFCGGSLINEQDIITAAHCFVQFGCENPKADDVSKNRLINVRKRQKFRVIIGLNDLMLEKTNPSRGIIKMIKRVFIHRNYAQINSRTINDLAVVRLAEPLNEFDRGSHVKDKFGSIDLFRPHKNNKVSEYDVQGEVFGAGFGAITRTTEGKYEYNGLRKITKFRFTDNDESQYPGVKHVQYVGYASTAQGFCMGDSGGPIYLKNDVNEFQLVGVMSTGPCDCDMRNSTGRTGKVTFIPEFLDFLKSISDVDESQIIEETSLPKYEKTGTEYFVLPDHNTIAKRKYFNKTVL